MPCCNPLWLSLSARSARWCRVFRGISVHLNFLGFRPLRSQESRPQWRRPSCCSPILFCGRLLLSLELPGCYSRRRRNRMPPAKPRIRPDPHLCDWRSRQAGTARPIYVISPPDADRLMCFQAQREQRFAFLALYSAMDRSFFRSLCRGLARRHPRRAGVVLHRQASFPDTCQATCRLCLFHQA
jgi:hypothetical protein